MTDLGRERYVVKEALPSIYYIQWIEITAKNYRGVLGLAVAVLFSAFAGFQSQLMRVLLDRVGASIITIEG